MIKSIGVLLADIHYLISAQVIMPLDYLKIRRAARRIHSRTERCRLKAWLWSVLTITDWWFSPS